MPKNAPKYNVEVKIATYKDMPADQEFVNAFKKMSGDIARKLRGSQYAEFDHMKVFALGENGKMTLLHNPLGGRRLSFEDVAKAARANCLFVPDEDGGLHQIGMEKNNGEIEVTVSEPIKDNPPTSSPSLWTYIKAFFNNKEAKAEVDAYRVVKTFNDAFRKLAGDKRYDIKLNPERKPLEKEEEPEIVEEDPQAEAERKAAQDAIDKENFRKEQDQRKQEWDRDVSKMMPEEFMEYRNNLTNVDVLHDDYKPLIENKHATVDDLYDFVARDLERRVCSDHVSLERKLEFGRVESLKYENAHMDFIAVQRESWQKMKEFLHTYARENVSLEAVQKALNAHDYKAGARIDLDLAIRDAFEKIDPDTLKRMGVVFQEKDLTPQMVKDMMVVKHQREGQVGMQAFSESLKQQIANQQDGPQAQQKQVQPVQKTEPNKGKSIGV